ncbi:MAG: elongation factor EF-2, partial [Candidatus Methanomethylophilaceae archaeon]
MGRKEDNIKKASMLIKKPEFIRNIGTAAHIDHGKTTFSDNLIAGAGMMSEELSGKQRLLDFDEQEQARGITINAANASMVHTYKGHDYLINLIDTPGHVDFGGDVTRAMRALDGAFILACAVEGVMPQTETVIRQAMKERVKPLLFINKVDRLINELQVTPEAMMEKFAKIITEFNKRVNALLPAPLNKEWQVKVENGTVAFGSAYHNWAISVPYMKKSGISFKEAFDYCAQGKQKELSKKSPLHEVLLDMAITHIQNPLDAQKVRIPVIWKGDETSELGRQMLDCDPEGEVTLMVNKIIMDPHAGEVAIGRLFSGTVTRGQTLWVSGMPNPQRVQTVAMSVGADRIPVTECCAGNIVAITGLKDAIAGSTVSTVKDMEPFEKITHYSEPVVTKAIEAKHMKDLPKLVEVLRSVAKADPSLNIEINNETGEHLLSGMGELHLEITEYRIVNEQGIEIVASPPIVVYQESVKGHAGPFEGKSPNKHNKFYIEVEPVPQAVLDAIKAGDISTSGKIKDPKAVARQLVELGMDKDVAKGLVAFKDNNMLLDCSKGVQNLFETMELVKQAFEEAMTKGP